MADAKRVRIVHRKLDRLLPYIRNTRTHSPEQIGQIAASITEFGFNNPILIDAAGGIIAGHGRVMAARQLGLEDVPCIVLAHLTDDQKRAYVIADNKLAEGAGWDEALLRAELTGLKVKGADLSVLGFSDRELEGLVGLENGAADDLVDEDADQYGGATSIARGSAPLRHYRKGGLLRGRVLDFGSGQDEHEFARYDMVHAPDPGVLLAEYDTILCNYVLNVQPSDHLVDLILALIWQALADDGHALIAVVTEKSLSNTAATGNRPAKPKKEWKSIIGRIFAQVDPIKASFCGFSCKR